MTYFDKKNNVQFYTRETNHFVEFMSSLQHNEHSEDGENKKLENCKSFRINC